MLFFSGFDHFFFYLLLSNKFLHCDHWCISFILLTKTWSFGFHRSLQNQERANCWEPYQQLGTREERKKRLFLAPALLFISAFPLWAHKGQSHKGNYKIPSWLWLFSSCFWGDHHPGQLPRLLAALHPMRQAGRVVLQRHGWRTAQPTAEAIVTKQPLPRLKSSA